MAISLADLAALIRRRGLDEEEPYRWSDDLITDGVREGLVALADFAGAIKSKTWAVTEDDTSALNLPDDFMRQVINHPYQKSAESDDETLGVMMRDEYLGEYGSEIGDFHADADELTSPLGYQVYGGQVHLLKALDSGDSLTLVYEGLWNSPVDNNDIISIPFWGQRALSYYVIFYCLQSQGVLFSLEGFWKDRVDSGNPLQNPALKSADWFLKKFQEICQPHLQQRAIDGRS